MITRRLFISGLLCSASAVAVGARMPKSRSYGSGGFVSASHTLFAGDYFMLEGRCYVAIENTVITKEQAIHMGIYKLERN